MPRGKKQTIKINDIVSLEGLCQEMYNDACSQIYDAQKATNELTTSAKGETVDDYTKIAKERGGLLKVKDSAIRIKLELAKLQIDIIKKNGDTDAAIAENTGFSADATVTDFKAIREMFKKDRDNNVFPENE